MINEQMKDNTNVEEESILELGAYNPSDCQVSVMHVGVGSFHRAHQAVYFHNLLQLPEKSRWGIAGINLRPQDAELLNKLKKNDSKYILKTLSSVGQPRFEEIKSILSLYDWTSDKAEILSIFADPQLQMITITVTESGYYTDDSAQLDKQHPTIQAEVTGQSAQTIYGFLREGLMHRLKKGGQPITIACCDNLRENGSNLERWFRQYLNLFDGDELLTWIDSRSVTFPCSMVDRITPRPPSSLNNEISKLLQRSVSCSVMAEDFIQWVIEDKFAGTRPELDKVGVEIVADVHPYEEAKIRILNGGHAILAYLGALKNYNTYDEALRDPELSEFFDKFELEEVLPGLPTSSPVDHLTYQAIIRKRFENTFIADTLARICMDGASKFPIFILPTIKARLAAKVMPSHTITGIAGWYQFMCKVKAGQSNFEYIETKWEMILPLLAEGSERQFAECAELWSDVPKHYPDFVDTLVSCISEMRQKYPVYEN